MGSLKLSHCVQELVGIKRAEYGVGVDNNLAATVAEEEFNRTDGKKQLVKGVTGMHRNTIFVT
jgi:hypothetical protein